MLELRLSLNFDNFDLDIEQCFATNSITAILGHSGSGKTSLLRIIAGLNKDARGSVVFNQRVMQDDQQFIAPDKRRIGFVFQDARLFPHLDVQSNLLYALKRRQHGDLTLATISQLTQVTPLLTRRVDKLSAGEKQRVALARALLSDPQLLLLDEPLSSLDNHSRGAMIKLLKHIHDTLSLPMLYVSHSVVEVQQLADHVIVMSEGKIKQSGHVHQVLNQLEPSLNNDFSLQTSLSLTIKRHLYDYGLTELILPPPLAQHSESENLTLYSNIIDRSEGSIVRAYVMASDISICLDKPENSSINNIIAATVVSISALSNNLALVKVGVLNTQFSVTISRYSQQKLALDNNKTVYIQFKASAIRHL
ncbi:molybdenum ABC transporter ATP-binding protein [Thalassotalea ponticola]|uniref:molybdenum ABC transporter ATP-binding protein n=1 Tax=Thalassotalea ponticola TaxID=1523392 RepID=UPI0025B33ED3|nr:molybdenum ABC transporter ATP-binding protein [Thalassotalea ponticola]MDN3651903.1 molybdenum ABC transporter ATP-binding protein [Thalassotalea ponticola]